MKKTALLLAIIIVTLASCHSTKAIMNSYVGHTKQEVIANWGPPAKVDSDGGSGEVLTWYGSAYILYGYTYYPVRMFYCDSRGVVYNWVTHTVNTPPQQLNVRLY